MVKRYSVQMATIKQQHVDTISYKIDFKSKSAIRDKKHQSIKKI
jgi:hypothetical protein